MDLPTRARARARRHFFGPYCIKQQQLLDVETAEGGLEDLQNIGADLTH